MNANNLYLLGKDKDNGEWIIAIQDRPEDLDGFRELAHELLAKKENLVAVEIREHTSRLVEVVDQ